jgi:hypothetical protein
MISMSGYIPCYAGSAFDLLTPRPFSVSGTYSANAFDDRSTNVVGYYLPSFTLDSNSPLGAEMPIYSAYASSNGYGPVNVRWDSPSKYGFDTNIVVTDVYLTAHASLRLRRWDSARTASAEYYAEFKPALCMLKDAYGYSCTASQYVSGLGYSAIGMYGKMSSFTANTWRTVDGVSITASAASASVYNQTAKTASYHDGNFMLPMFTETIQNCDMGYTFEWGLSGKYWRNQ